MSSNTPEADPKPAEDTGNGDAAPATPKPDTPPTDSPKPDDAPAQETDWKAEARKWESLAKKNKEAAARLAEIEEASKTEAEKQAEALAAAEAKVKEYETREQIANWKAEVSEETGVPASVLAGSTKEEIEAHAETLKPLIENAQQQSQEPPRPGAVPTIGKTPETPRNLSISEQIAAAEEAGDKTLVSQLKAMQLGAAT